jgi:hypothetical protein
MINYQCFERSAMSGYSEQSETTRIYFVKLRDFITENQHLIYQVIENKDNLHKYFNFFYFNETIYFFAVDDRNNNMFTPLKI